jgi:phosphoribosylformimino-5-aminoimidazole carboxamide ribotide isomerase
MLILPAIDLLEGQCVRLSQGNYAHKTVYTDDAVSVAKSFEEQGAKWLHIVDLDGARSGDMKNLHIVAQIANACGLNIEFGGGIRSRAAAQLALDAGATRVVIGSKIVQDPDLAAALFRDLGERAVAGLDARNGKVSITGWTETSQAPVEEVAEWVEKSGARRIILTDISKDGMLVGPNIQLLQSVLAVVAIPVIQSGGIATIQDVAALQNLPHPRAEGVIIGKAIYEGKVDLSDAIEKFQGKLDQVSIYSS